MKTQFQTSLQTRFASKEARKDKNQKNTQHGGRSSLPSKTRNGSRWIPRGPGGASPHVTKNDNNSRKNLKSKNKNQEKKKNQNNKNSSQNKKHRKKSFKSRRQSTPAKNDRKSPPSTSPEAQLRPYKSQTHPGSGSRPGFETPQRKDKRSQNHNHLLNFSYGDVPSYHSHKNRSGGIRTRRPSRVTPFDKEKFVQANYRFIIGKNTTQNLARCMADPDYVVEWRSVEQVIYPTLSIPKCPICMDTPVCPKITKCGHIFCWTCMIQYMSIGSGKEEKKCRYKRCPLCFESVYPNALKSLRFEVPKGCKVGGKMDFVLVERPKGSILPTLAGSRKDHLELSLSDPTQCSALHRVTATENILPILQEEQRALCELKRKIHNEKEAEREDMSRVLPFIEEALDGLRKRTVAWVEANSSCQNNDQQKVSKLSRSFSNMQDSFDDDDDEEAQATQVADKKVSKLSANAKEWTPRKKLDPKNSYFYYQAADGQNVFMHGINYRCLLHEHKTLDYIPKNVKAAKVLSIERFALTPETRSKLNFFKHLPLTTEVTICFLDLSSMLSPETLAVYREPLLALKKKRDKLKKLQRKEEERRRRHEKAVNSKPLLQSYGNDGYGYMYTDPESLNFGTLDENSFPDLVESKLSDGEKSTPNASPQMAGKSGWSEVLQKGYAQQDWPTLSGYTDSFTPPEHTPSGTPEAVRAKTGAGGGSVMLTEALPAPALNSGNQNIVWGRNVAKGGRSLFKSSNSNTSASGTATSQSQGQGRRQQPCAHEFASSITFVKKKKKGKKKIILTG